MLDWGHDWPFDALNIIYGSPEMTRFIELDCADLLRRFVLSLDSFDGVSGNKP